MKDNIKNIFNLSKIFIKENDNKFKNIFNIKDKKFNVKSWIFWVVIILFCAITYLSYEVMHYLKGIGEPEIFLNGYFLMFEVLIIFQVIVVGINIYYFSKDIEYVLPLPFKPIELLISKYNTILFMVYCVEIIFCAIPIIMYGIYMATSLLFYINALIILIVFPIFSIIVLSIIIMLIMRCIKVFKNKDVMQFIISAILMIILTLFLNSALNYVFTNQEMISNDGKLVFNHVNEKIVSINKHFLVINPCTEILSTSNFFMILLNYIKLIFINLLSGIIFYFIGKKIYLKQLLKVKFYNKNKRKINLNKKLIKKNIGITYVKKEFKLLYKNPLLFTHCIYPVFILTLIVVFICILFIPIFIEILNMEEYVDLLAKLKFNIEDVCIIVGIIQFVGLFNYTSITSFSREGNNAGILKSLPINLYKQFIYKNIPQILVNTICSIIILFIIKYEIPAIQMMYIFIMFLLAFILNCINSYILSLIDLLMPKINWNSEYEVLKNNSNKLLQYFLIVINIVVLYYLNSFFEKYNLNKSLIAILFVLVLIFIIINLLINKFKNKLFKKIN